MNKDIVTITPYPIVQMCWVVDDMDTAAWQWIKTMGAGPFFRIPHIQLDELTYRGKRAILDQSSAVGQWGLAWLVDDERRVFLSSVTTPTPDGSVYRDRVLR